MIWELEGYDTELREARCREYTRSQRTADLWVRIPRLQFSDSGHGVVFTRRPHSGARRLTIRRMDYADEWLRKLRAAARPPVEVRGERGA